MSVPPFQNVVQKLGLDVGDLDDHDIIDVPFKFLKLLLQYAVSTEGFSEELYLAKYPDVAQSVDGGDFSSGAKHYLIFGYFEGRDNPEIEVDEDWYVNQYANVFDEIKAHKLDSVRRHYELVGRPRGYAPNPRAASDYNLWDQMIKST